MHPAVTADAKLQPDRQSVDDRDAHTMQTAGHLVGILVELATGMELRHDHFGSGDALAGMNVGRDARPLSVTVTEPSAFNVTVTRSA